VSQRRGESAAPVTVEAGKTGGYTEKTRRSNCPYEMKNRLKVTLWTHEDKQNFREFQKPTKRSKSSNNPLP
jgi:hypothetical protein